MSLETLAILIVLIPLCGVILLGFYLSLSERRTKMCSNSKQEKTAKYRINKKANGTYEVEKLMYTMGSMYYDVFSYYETIKTFESLKKAEAYIEDQLDKGTIVKEYF